MENDVLSARGTKKDTESFYVEVKDGYGNIERQLNFDNPKVCPRKGLIELIPLKERKGFENRVMFRRVLDKETRTWIGIPSHVDPKEKTFVYGMITLIGRRIYDLTNEKDAKEWACIKNSPYLEGSPNQDRSNPPVYKVYDKEKQASENLQKTRLKRRAEQVADGLTGDNLDDMLRACGIGIKGMSDVMKLNAITQYAESNPKEFLAHWESPTRKEAFVLKQAVDFDIIQNDQNVGFVYRTIGLGLNEQEAVSYLQAHPNVSSAIETLVLQKKEESEKSNVVTQAPIASSKEADLKNANDRIKELEAALDKQSKTIIATESGKSLEGKAPNNELETLKAQAKALKIKGWHLLGQDKLEAAIKKAEAKN